MVTTGKQLRTALRVADISQEKAAEALGVSRPTLSTWLNRAELSEEVLQNVKTKLNIDLTTETKPISDLAASSPNRKTFYETKHPASSTPMYTSASTASEVEVYSDTANEGPAFYVSIPQFSDCSFGKMVFGHSMYPTYESGTYIFCKPVADKYHIIPGEVYYIEIDNFGYCKRLQLSETAGEYLAESDNEEVRKDGLRKYRTFPIEIDKIRKIYLVKGHFKQSQN